MWRYMQKKLFLNLHKRPRKGQVFILASLLLVVYAVSIIALLSEVSIDQSNTDSNPNLSRSLNDFISELDNFQTILIARVTQGNITTADLSSSYSNFISQYQSYLQNKGIFSSITNLGPISSTNLRATNSNNNLTDVLVSLETTVQVVLNTGSSSDQVQLTYTLFTGFNATYNNSQWFISHVDKNGYILNPILGVDFYLNGVQVIPTTEYNGYYKIILDPQTQIRLPNGIFIYN